MNGLEDMPKEVASSQDQMAQEFLRHGSVLVEDTDADKLRVHLTPDQLVGGANN